MVLVVHLDFGRMENNYEKVRSTIELKRDYKLYYNENFWCPTYINVNTYNTYMYKNTLSDIIVF